MYDETMTDREVIARMRASENAALAADPEVVALAEKLLIVKMGQRTGVPDVGELATLSTLCLWAATAHHRRVARILSRRRDDMFVDAECDQETMWESLASPSAIDRA